LKRVFQLMRTVALAMRSTDASKKCEAFSNTVIKLYSAIPVAVIFWEGIKRGWGIQQRWKIRPRRDLEPKSYFLDKF